MECFLGGGMLKKRGECALLTDCEGLTLREIQYMKLIRGRNDIMYSEVLHQVQQEKAK